MSRSRNRLVADWFAKIRANETTGEAEHTDVTATATADHNHDGVYLKPNGDGSQLTNIPSPVTFTLNGDVLDITTQ